VRATLFVQELDKICLLTATFIGDRLAPLREELDRRERLDAVFDSERAIDLGISVNVGNNTLKGISTSEWWTASECNVLWFRGGSPEQLRKA
jgi:hypothetical protein